MLKLLKHLKPYRAQIAVVMVLIFLQTISQLYLPTLMADIVDIGIVNGDVPYILRIGAYMMLVATVGGVLIITSGYLSAKVSVGFGRDLRERVFTRAENYSLYEFDKIGTASLITRTTNDISQIQRVVIMGLRMLVSAPMMLVGGIIMSVSKDPTLSLTIVLSGPILAITVIAIAKKGVPLFRVVQKKLDKVNRVLRENLTGIRVIRAFDRTEYEKKRFNEANLDLTNTSIQVNRLMAIMWPIMMFLMNATTIAIVWYGGHRISAGVMQVGDLMAFVQYVMQIMFSLMMVSMMFVMLPRASASAERINEVLELEPEIVDPSEPVVTNELHGHVEFKQVSFSYPGAEEPAIQKISFTATPGKTTAIIGSTGSGKSTLINLIPRFYDVDSGSVLVNGVNVQEMTQAQLRAKIGLVPQQSVLFSGTVNDNVSYGKQDATSEEVQEAIVTAQASDFVSHLQQGVNSHIAQGGNNLSGGQKQRLAIARALIRQPEIYIFDDSFSALDFKTDAKLRAALKYKTKKATVIIVAQRVSTVMDADQIIVLDKGEMVSRGTHDELFASCEVYHEIVTSQLSEEEIA